MQGWCFEGRAMQTFFTFSGYFYLDDGAKAV